MIPILVLKSENKVIYNKSNLNCKTFFEEFSSYSSMDSKKYREEWKWQKYARPLKSWQSYLSQGWCIIDFTGVFCPGHGHQMEGAVVVSTGAIYVGSFADEEIHALCLPLGGGEVERR